MDCEHYPQGQVVTSILSTRSLGSEIPLLAEETYRKGSLMIPKVLPWSTEMDQEWTTDIE